MPQRVEITTCHTCFRWQMVEQMRVSNIEPLNHADHVQLHMDNGDFRAGRKAVRITGRYVMDTGDLTPCAAMHGEDEEDSSLLMEMLVEARNYLRSFRWCPPIAEEFLGFGIGRVFALFLFRFAKHIRDADDYLWVVVGDLPTAYFVIDEAPDPRSATKVYCQIMQDWINAVLNKTPLDDVFPVKADATVEMAQMLDSRLRFLREKVIPMIPT